MQFKKIIKNNLFKIKKIQQSKLLEMYLQKIILLLKKIISNSKQITHKDN